MAVDIIHCVIDIPIEYATFVMERIGFQVIVSSLNDVLERSSITWTSPPKVRLITDNGIVIEAQRL